MSTKMWKITLLKDTPIPESRWLYVAELFCKRNWGSLDRRVILHYRGRLKIITGGTGVVSQKELFGDAARYLTSKMSHTGSGVQTLGPQLMVQLWDFMASVRGEAWLADLITQYKLVNYELYTAWFWFWPESVSLPLSPLLCSPYTPSPWFVKM